MKTSSSIRLRSTGLRRSALRALGLAAGVILITAVPAMAQGVCMDQHELHDRLAEKWHEAPVSAGLAGDGKLVQVYSSPEGETWTILLTTPEGRSCIIGSGRFWLKDHSGPHGKGDLATF